MADDSLADILTRKHSEPRGRATEPNEPMLPDPSGVYAPYSLPATRQVYTVHFLLGRDGCRSFQYVHLDSDSGFTTDDAGQSIRLRFSGSKLLMVVIRGRNLWQLYDYLHQHRVAWVMRQDAGRDFAADGETVVTDIRMEEVKETQE